MQNLFKYRFLAVTPILSLVLSLAILFALGTTVARAADTEEEVVIERAPVPRSPQPHAIQVPAPTTTPPHHINGQVHHQPVYYAQPRLLDESPKPKVKWTISGYAGGAYVSCNGCDARFGYGAGVGVLLANGISMELVGTTSQRASGQYGLRKTLAAAELNYHLAGLYVGGRVAGVFESVLVSSNFSQFSEVNQTQFGAGGQAGFDIAANDRFSVGAKAIITSVFAQPVYYNIFEGMVVFRVYLY